MNTLYIYCDFGNRVEVLGPDGMEEKIGILCQKSNFSIAPRSTGLFLSFFLFHIIILFDLFRSTVKSIGVFFTANQKWQ